MVIDEVTFITPNRKVDIFFCVYVRDSGDWKCLTAKRDALGCNPGPSKD